MDELVQAITKTYGLVGLMIAAPYYLCWILLRMYREANKETAAVQQQRVADAQAISDKIIILVKEQTAMDTETKRSLDQFREALVLSASAPLPTSLAGRRKE